MNGGDSDHKHGSEVAAHHNHHREDKRFHRYYNNEDEDDEDFYRDLLSTTATTTAGGGGGTKSNKNEGNNNLSGSSFFSSRRMTTPSLLSSRQQSAVHQVPSSSLSSSSRRRRVASSSSLHSSSSNSNASHYSFVDDEHNTDSRRRKLMLGRRVRRSAKDLSNVLSSSSSLLPLYHDNKINKNKTQSSSEMAPMVKMESSSLSSTSSSSQSVGGITMEDNDINHTRDFDFHKNSGSAINTKHLSSCSSWSHFDTCTASASSSTTTMRRYPRQQQQQRYRQSHSQEQQHHQKYDYNQHHSFLDNNDGYVYNSLCLGPRATTSTSSARIRTKPTLNGSLSSSSLSQTTTAKIERETSKSRRRKRRSFLSWFHSRTESSLPSTKEDANIIMYIPLCFIVCSFLGVMVILYNIMFLSPMTTSTTTKTSKSSSPLSFSRLRQWKKNNHGNYGRHYFDGKKKSLVKDSVYVSEVADLEELLRHTREKFKSREWPLSVVKETGKEGEFNFEVIKHPANATVTLSVPRFYISSNNNIESKSHEEESKGRNHHIQSDKTSSVSILGGGKLLPRSISDNIGTKINEDDGQFDDDNEKYTDDYKNAQKTIYVTIASYKDRRCRHTVESIFSMAAYPDRIRVGVVDQSGGVAADVNDNPDHHHDVSCNGPITPCETDSAQAFCRYRDQIDVYEMDSNLAVGPMFARHIGHRMYRGEYFVLQATSRLIFVADWDVEVIEQWERTGNEMAVLSTYSTNLEEDDMDEMTGKIMRIERPVLCDASFEGDGKARGEMRLRHPKWRQPDVSAPGKVGVASSPQLQPFWSSEFSFSRGHFVLAVPYDPWLPMIERDDEEISMAVRAFTHGYDFYTPERLISFRVVTQSEDQLIDEGDDEVSSALLEQAALYAGKESSSLDRLFGLLGMNPEIDPSSWDHRDEELYGVGKVREASKFFSCFGIHVKERVAEQKLCDFVTSGNMHNLFAQNLREDGMGIDYNEIHFRFHELIRIHEYG